MPVATLRQIGGRNQWNGGIQHACLLKAILLQNLLTVVPIHLYPPVVSRGKFSVTTGGNFPMTDDSQVLEPGDKIIPIVVVEEDLSSFNTPAHDVMEYSRGV